jgi:hypothetical protein
MRGWICLVFCVLPLSGCWLVSSFDFPSDAGADSSPAEPQWVQGTWHSFDNEARSHTFAFEKPVRAGDTLVVAFAYPSSVQAATVSDSLGNPYSIDQVQKSTDPPDGTWFGLAYAQSPTGGVAQVTVSLTDTTLLDLYLAEFSGSLVFAKGTEMTGDGSKAGGTDGLSSGSVSLMASSALIVAFAVGEDVEQGSQFRQTASSPSSAGVLEYRIVSPAEGTFGATATLTCSSSWGVVMNAFVEP